MKEKLLFTSLLLLIFSMHILADEPEIRVNLNLKDVTVETFLNEVKKQTGISMFYNTEILKDAEHVTVNVKNERWQTVFEQVLFGRSLTYTYKDGVIVIKRDIHAGKRIVGSVLDENGLPIAGATVDLRYSNGRHMYTVTSTNGDFIFNKTGTEKAIYISYIGYEKRSISIKENEDYYKITLPSSKNKLEEVVVTGIFNKPKVSFTGAATVITKDQLMAAGNRNLLQSISNIDPSFDIQEDNTNGSDPNRKLSIEIRGASSLSPDITNMNNLQDNVRNEYNMPLFILDGFEITSQRVMDMNQADVESVVILKDASATAIYGSRGANGVVVITSAKPQVGKLRVSYSAGLNLEIPDLSSYKLMNSFQKIETEKEAGLYTSSTLSTQLELNDLYNENLKAAQEGVNTDWIHKPIQTGVGQYHSLNLGGGNDQFRYILHASYNQLTGSMKGSKRDNLNAGMQISYLLHKVRFTNDLSLGFDNAANSMYGTLSTYAKMNPYWRPYNDDGTPVTSYDLFLSTYSPLYNPLYDAAQTSFSTTNYTNIRNTTNINFNLFKDLRFDMSLGISQEKGGSDNFTSPKASDYLGTSTAASSKGLYAKTIYTRNSYQVATTASWAKVLGKHSLYAGINWQMMQNTYEETSLSVKGFLNDKMTDISNGSSYSGTKPTCNETTTRTLGFTGTLNYNFNDRYFIDGSYRLDGASSFGKLSRWAPFWSVGFGWEFSKEKLVKKFIPAISYGKFRYSYGTTSTLNFSPYDAFTTYEYDNTREYNYLTGASIIAYGNPNLKWQNTKENNFGLDMSLFHDRVSITANYYRKTTSNLISDAYLPISHGYSSYKENLGVVRNTGYDMSAIFNIIKIPENNISWSVRVGMYNNNNVLIKLSDAIKKVMASIATWNASNTTLYMYKEGRSMDELYVLRSAGVDPLTGNRLYIDDDGTVTTTVSNITKVAVGNSQPKINGRLGTTFHWQGLMVDLGFGCRWGGKKLNSTLLNKVENADIRYNQDRRVMTARWKNPGDICAYKDLSSTTDTYACDAFVFTEKTFTFNSLNITYELPASLIKKFRMERLALTASMTDIFYISNIEQERGTTYPYTKEPTFSVSCTF